MARKSIAHVSKGLPKIGSSHAASGISYHILPVAATMAGVCVTITTFFHVTRSGGVTLADELVALDAFLFIISCFLSYLSIRGSDVRREYLADNIFFVAMLLMVLAGVMMLFTQ